MAIMVKRVATIEDLCDNVVNELMSKVGASNDRRFLNWLQALEFNGSSQKIQLTLAAP